MFDEIIASIQKDNPGKPKSSFATYESDLNLAYEFGSIAYDDNKSPEWNIAFIQDNIELSMPNKFSDDTLFELAILILTNQ